MRRSGRTSRMLLNAVLAMTEETRELWIVGATYDQIVMHLLPGFVDICYALGLKLKRDGYDVYWGEQATVHFITLTRLLAEEGRYNLILHKDHIFIDHYAWEQFRG